MAIATSGAVRFRLIARSALVLLPLLMCAARLHAQRATPQGVTQEVNRCLSLVRVASSRRRHARPPCGRQRSVASLANGRSADQASATSARRTA
jgi:hypothetical protein